MSNDFTDTKLCSHAHVTIIHLAVLKVLNCIGLKKERIGYQDDSRDKKMPVFLQPIPRAVSLLMCHSILYDTRIRYEIREFVHFNQFKFTKYRYIYAVSCRTDH